MKTACPNCGGEVEFRFDDSFVRICDHCKSAVLRTDRDVESLGKVGDLMPTDSPLKLFAEGRAPGASGTFLLVGMAQMKHASGGTWQEWYAKGDGDRWAWLAEAQGRYYLTYETEIAAPAKALVVVGGQVELDGKAFTVAELGTATYVSAVGEIPFRLQPDETFEFADLSDGQGAFATIDFGSAQPPHPGAAACGEDKSRVFLGKQVTLAELALAGGEDGAEAKKIASAKLACPNCNGALELRAPDAALRVVCPFCDNLIAIDGGNLEILQKLKKKPRLAIPLGSKCTFSEGELQVIGFVQRSAKIDGAWYSFDEYLLHQQAIGFRWLVCSDEHWSYVQPIAPGAVQNTATDPTYEGVAFRLYQNAPLRVDTVYGELYWACAIGETVQSQDYVAPPAMLSVEQNATEQNWSLSTYVTPKQVKAAFAGVELELGKPIGVAPNQVFGSYGWGLPMVLAFVALCAVGTAKCKGAKESLALQASFPIPVGAPAPATTDPTAEAPGSVVFSDKFHLDGGKNIRFDLFSDVTNNWMYVAIDLVNDTTGEVVSFDTNIEYYAGYEDGESWSEGSHESSEVIGPQPAGDYVLRLEAQHGSPTVQQLHVGVRQDIFRGKYFWLAFGILFLPLGIMALRAHSFHKAQWENSNTIYHGGDDD